METLLGRVLGDLAAMGERKWFMVIGLAGVVMILWTALAGTPNDNVLVAAIGFAMMGFGFGEAETRVTKRETIEVGGVSRRRVLAGRVPTRAGYALYATGAAGALTALIRAGILIW